MPCSPRPSPSPSRSTKGKAPALSPTASPAGGSAPTPASATSSTERERCSLNIPRRLRALCERFRCRDGDAAASSASAEAGPSSRGLDFDHSHTRTASPPTSPSSPNRHDGHGPGHTTASDPANKDVEMDGDGLDEKVRRQDERRVSGTLSLGPSPLPTVKEPSPPSNTPSPPASVVTVSDTNLAAPPPLTVITRVPGVSPLRVRRREDLDEDEDDDRSSSRRVLARVSPPTPTTATFPRSTSSLGQAPIPFRTSFLPARDSPTTDPPMLLDNTQSTPASAGITPAPVPVAPPLPYLSRYPEQTQVRPANTNVPIPESWAGARPRGVDTSVDAPRTSTSGSAGAGTTHVGRRDRVMVPTTTPTHTSPPTDTADVAAIATTSASASASASATSDDTSAFVSASAATSGTSGAAGTPTLGSVSAPSRAPPTPPPMFMVTNGLGQFAPAGTISGTGTGPISSAGTPIVPFAHPHPQSTSRPHAELGDPPPPPPPLTGVPARIFAPIPRHRSVTGTSIGGRQAHTHTSIVLAAQAQARAQQQTPSDPSIPPTRDSYGWTPNWTSFDVHPTTAPHGPGPGIGGRHISLDPAEETRRAVLNQFAYSHLFQQTQPARSSSASTDESRTPSMPSRHEQLQARLSRLESLRSDNPVYRGEIPHHYAPLPFGSESVSMASRRGRTAAAAAAAAGVGVAAGSSAGMHGRTPSAAEMDFYLPDMAPMASSQSTAYAAPPPTHVRSAIPRYQGPSYNRYRTPASLRATGQRDPHLTGSADPIGWFGPELPFELLPPAQPPASPPVPHHAHYDSALYRLSQSTGLEALYPVRDVNEDEAQAAHRIWGDLLDDPIPVDTLATGLHDPMRPTALDHVHPYARATPLMERSTQVTFTVPSTRPRDPALYSPPVPVPTIHTQAPHRGSGTGTGNATLSPELPRSPSDVDLRPLEAMIDLGQREQGPHRAMPIASAATIYDAPQYLRHHWQQQAQRVLSPSFLRHYRIDKDWPIEKQKHIVSVVVKLLNGFSAAHRRGEAQSVLRHVYWEDSDATCASRGIEKVAHCAVCYEDYTAGDKLAFTPCNHVYHSSCLDTWLETPLTPAAHTTPVTCPMCRRNLATLALITRIVWSKDMDDAIPLWMDHMATAVESQVRQTPH